MTWTLWGVVLRPDAPSETKEEMLRVPGVYQGRDLLLYQGTLTDFRTHYNKSFLVTPKGATIYIDPPLEMLNVYTS